jgi:hypothetical protein
MKKRVIIRREADVAYFKVRYSQLQNDRVTGVLSPAETKDFFL